MVGVAARRCLANAVRRRPASGRNDSDRRHGSISGHRVLSRAGCGAPGLGPPAATGLEFSQSGTWFHQSRGRWKTPASFPVRMGYPFNYRSAPVHDTRSDVPLYQAPQELLGRAPPAQSCYRQTHHSGAQAFLYFEKSSWGIVENFRASGAA